MGSLPTDTMVRSIAVDPLTPQRIYAAGPSGLFRSEDGGLTWAKADDGLTGELLAVTLDPIAPDTVFVVTTDSSVWKSSDGARTWQIARPGE